MHEYAHVCTYNTHTYTAYTHIHTKRHISCKSFRPNALCVMDDEMSISEWVEYPIVDKGCVCVGGEVKMPLLIHKLSLAAISEDISP